MERDISNVADPSSSSPPQNTVEGGGGLGEINEGTPEAGGPSGDINEQEGSNDVEVAESSSTGGVPVLGPAIVYTKDGKALEVDDETSAAVDNFPVPAGFVRKGCRVDSFMYSVGVYIEEDGGKKHKYHCLASGECRRKKRVVPCTNGDRSNVNTHLRRAHGMQGTAGVRKQSTKRNTQASIQKCLAASVNSGLGKNRCVCGCVPFFFRSCKGVIVQTALKTAAAVVGRLIFTE